MLYLKKRFNAIMAMTLIFVLTGCVTQRDLEYMQAKDKNTQAYTEAEMPDYKLKPNDELYIQFSSLDPAEASIFADARGQQTTTTMDPFGASLISYSIDKDGFLLLPVLGKIQVKDRTLSQVSSILTDSLSHILSQPMVKVKLVNRYVSVLGYVSRPGHYPYSQDKLSIYDALGLAGDITVYGNREEITLTRTENGKNIRKYIDLTSPEILGSEYYYLRPNDMIYVKPLKKRFWGMQEFPFATLLSALSVTLLFYTVIKP
jgi:polysaccharide export outer membrane protein